MMRTDELRDLGLTLAGSPFQLADMARRLAGQMFDWSGLGPQESAHREVARLRGAALRAYQPVQTDVDAPALLIIPAPLKRPYIWDLLPAVSVVRRLRSRGIRVYLLEWDAPAAASDDYGLDDYAARLPAAALTAIAAETGLPRIALAGHSLGGTFAAIFACLEPERIEALALIDAPLAFGPDGGRLSQWLQLMPSTMETRVPVAGSAIDVMVLGLAPDIFLWNRWRDLTASLADRRALAVHACVERWTLDESALPGRLLGELADWLYREDRFRNGQLPVAGQVLGIERLRAPLVAVVNPHGGVVPPESVLRALDYIPDLPRRICWCGEERGIALQHLSPLVGSHAHSRLWPDIIDWLRR